MKRADILWMAGLLEGEGCFNLRRDKGANPQPRVSIEMTDLDVIERIAELWGSNVSYRKARLSGRCSICGETADCSMVRAYQDGRADERDLKEYGFAIATKPSYQTAVYGAQAINVMRMVYALMGSRRAAKIEEILEACGEVVL